MTKFHRTETRYLATHIGRITMIFKSKYFKSKCDKVKTSSDIIAKTLRSKSILLIPSWINCKSVAPQPTEKKYTDGHSWCIFLFATSVGTFCANAPFRYILCYDSDHWLIIRAIILRYSIIRGSVWWFTPNHCILVMVTSASLLPYEEPSVATSMLTVTCDISSLNCINVLAMISFHLI